MISSWIISGVPRMTQTKRLVRMLRGLNFDMEPNMMTSPRGAAPSSVTANSRRVCRKPIFRD